MLSVNTNIASNYGQFYSDQAEKFQRHSMLNLSTGSRVNNSADDAVGLAVSNKILSTIKGLGSSAKNTADGISLAKIAQNSASQISDLIIRIRELAIQNHNGVYTNEDRKNSQHEASALLNQIDQIANHTTFNEKKILDGTFYESFRTGNLNSENMVLNLKRLSSDSIGGKQHVALKSELLIVEPSFDIKNMTRMSINETQKININLLSMSNDFQTFVLTSPNGKFSISGPDANLFSINSENGNLISNGMIAHTKTAQNQNKYKINLTYKAPSGSAITELLRLKVNEVVPKISKIKTASSELASQEAQNVLIQATDFPSGTNNSILSSALKQFIESHPGGTFSLIGSDASNFTINSEGVIIGNLNYSSPKDLDQNNIYDFGLKYSLPTGDSFLEEITLTIQSPVPPNRPSLPCENHASKSTPSTLSPPTNLFREDNGTVLEAFTTRASSKFQATEAKKLSFSIFDDFQLTSNELRMFIQAFPGGNFSLIGDDSDHFKINKFGTIDLIANADFERKSHYNFGIEYRTNDKNFKNYVIIDLLDNTIDNSPKLSDINMKTSEGARQAVLIANKALEQVNSFQAYAGASENRLHKSLELINKNLATAKISRGRIIDSDFAVETTQLAITQIIMQSSQNIVLQANTAKQNLLALIE